LLPGKSLNAGVTEQLQSAIADRKIAEAKKRKGAGKIVMKRTGKRRSGPREKHA
jgi:hypothetical protein